MEITNSRSFAASAPALKTPLKVKEDVSVAEPSDRFVKADPEETRSFGGKIKGLAVKALLGFLDLPALSTTSEISKENKQKILDSIKPGDIILETDNNYPGWQVMEKIAGNSDFTHAAIYEGDGKFIEATTGHPSGMGVAKTELAEYLKGRVAIQIVRPPYKSEEDIKAALNYANSQIGKPYDGAFNYEDSSEQYCAELVAKALDAMPNKIETPSFEVLGRKVVLPNSFQKIEGAEVVYDDGSDFWKNQLSHSPAFIGGAVAAGAAALALGPVGVIGAFLGGTLLTSVTGGFIQISDRISARTH